MGLGFKELLVVLVIVLLLFGAGKLPSVMKEIGKGLRSFKKGLREDDLELEESKDDLKTDFTIVNDERIGNKKE